MMLSEKYLIIFLPFYNAMMLRVQFRIRSEIKLNLDPFHSENKPDPPSEKATWIRNRAQMSEEEYLIIYLPLHCNMVLRVQFRIWSEIKLNMDPFHSENKPDYPMNIRIRNYVKMSLRYLESSLYIVHGNILDPA